MFGFEFFDKSDGMRCRPRVAVSANGYHRVVAWCVAEGGRHLRHVLADLPCRRLTGDHVVDVVYRNAHHIRVFVTDRDASLPNPRQSFEVDMRVVACRWHQLRGAQMRGFYSYSWFERVAGADIRNANAVHLNWQDLRRGDSVWLARRYGDAARLVVAVKPNSYLLRTSPDDFDRVQDGAPAPSGMRLLICRTS
ncbi:hypothetical protein A5724_25045 [Mycobacterium sp. ACS1612]|nr:hypothetical protein A5724_25045 [Mycobacterium sp. ACS1612]